MLITPNIIIGLIIGIIAYTILNIGKGIQKYAIEGFKVDRQIKSKNSGVWIIGTILTGTYMFIQWIALLFAPINIIAPLDGFGLIVFIIFSYFVLKEEISKVEILGIVFIITGVVLITAFNPNKGIIQASDFNGINFLIISISLIVIELLLILISRSKDYRVSGLILGVTAGTLMAIQNVSKRITAVSDVTLTIIFGILTLIMATLTLITTQFAFTKSNANRVVPCFTSASIILSILMGIMSLNEDILLIQIIGIITIITGIILLSAFRREN
ncbi:MAG: DMT family transporter [Promethearchaeati archaeon]